MGFRDFNAFNKALLAKQVWRQLAHPNTLVAQIFRSKYFRTCNLMLVKAKTSSSFVWRSLLWGRDLLVKGVRWRVGNGQSINVFKDPWMLRPQSFKPITIPKAIHLNHRVADLININGEWNWALISGILWDVDAEEVKRILM